MKTAFGKGKIIEDYQEAKSQSIGWDFVSGDYNGGIIPAKGVGNA